MYVCVKEREEVAAVEGGLLGRVGTEPDACPRGVRHSPNILLWLLYVCPLLLFGAVDFGHDGVCQCALRRCS